MRMEGGEGALHAYVAITNSIINFVTKFGLRGKLTAQESSEKCQSVAVSQSSRIGRNVVPE